ncbi:MAG: photosystem II stability/assembly factor-like uncharacterized protein [Acidimicrobiales bacterium]|jgi:photosystem II stability/assembly factor-like uncharacterized protein
MMSNEYVIGIGTVGAGLWMSYNSGQKWRHIYKGGPDPESNCRALAVSPHNKGELLAASDRVGLFRSPDNGGNWEQIGDIADSDIWSIGYDPGDENRVYAGVRPGVVRSDDGGATFASLETSISPTCPIGVPRTTNVVVDPTDSNIVWASVEVDGLHRSTDGGETWGSLGDLGPGEFYNDVHGFTMRETADGSELLVSSPFGLGRSTDGGDSFEWHKFGGFEGSKFEFAYSRCVSAPWDDVIVVCVGDYIPGGIGALEISHDGGQSWTREPMPVTPNSTMYWLATHPDLPGTMVATSVFGQMYVSDDYAKNWRKLDREFSEIRSISLTPA